MVDPIRAERFHPEHRGQPALTSQPALTIEGPLLLLLYENCTDRRFLGKPNTTLYTIDSWNLCGASWFFFAVSLNRVARLFASPYRIHSEKK